ncbi:MULTISPECIES: helix-turn-helix domain-containing protein [Arthrobacter]|uniref:Helix-turn-helix domain-containing protein n=2 Tax=Arthrobacter TaxID=1663 RepID=A0ABU9KLI5_9MICC|nr:helix-turn-helix domain-containing protein [Arthrobacter sp. YJM1]MDP5226720.1 helix-turn-helix domain-containing protein [Arthrobacter sp. YJM1]
MTGADDTSGAAAAAAVTLYDCLQLLGPGVVHLNPGELQLRRPVQDTVILDALATPASWESRLVLAIGLTPEAGGFHDRLQRLADDGAAAVLLKAAGTPLEELRRLGSSLDLALLVIPDDGDWAHFVSMARASVAGASAGDTASGVRLGDLYAFANALASILGGAVSFVDTLGRILAYSTLAGQPIDEIRRTTTLTLRELTPPGLDADFRAVYGASGPVEVPSEDGGLGRLALAVRAGGELLGTVWIIDPGPSTRGPALKTLERMSPLIGLHMLHARTESDFGERRNTDLIRTLIEDPEHASYAAAQLGVSGSRGLAVGAFVFAQPEPGSLDSLRAVRQLVHLVTTVCRIHFQAGHAAVIDSVVYALLPGSGESQRQTHRRVAEEVVQYARTISESPLLAAAGPVAGSLEELAASRAGADLLLRLLGTRDGSATAVPASRAALTEDHQAELGILRVGEFLAGSGLTSDDPLSRIQAHDARHGTEFAATLSAYFQCNGNIARMAELMHLHNNTVRYRLSRLPVEVGVDLDHAPTRLWLALRLACA